MIRKLFCLFGVILLICGDFVAAQDKRFAFKGSAGSGSGGGGLSEEQVRAIVSDSAHVIPFGSHLRTKGVGKYLNVGRVQTAGQAARGYLNVYGLGDTLVAFVGDANRQIGDSSVFITNKGSIFVKTTYEPLSTAALILPNGVFFDASGVLFLAEIQSYSSGSAFKFHGGGAYGGGFSLMMGAGDKVKRGFWFGTTSGDTVATIYGGSNNSEKGRLIVGKKIKPAVMDQGFFTVRSWANSDTVALFRNDNNSTLDSTVIIFPDGRLSRTDSKNLPAASWVGTASRAPALDTVAYIVGYQFDKTTAETLTVDFELPEHFRSIRSVDVEVMNPNTAGDSVGFALAWLGRAEGEDMTTAFSSPLSAIVDLGTVQDARKTLTVTGTFGNLDAGDRIILKLWRDTSISNNVNSDVFLVDVKVNGYGLLR